MAKEYALYKGDELIVVGTCSEIAEHQNVQKKTVWFWNSPAYKKRINSRKHTHGNFKVLISLDD